MMLHHLRAVFVGGALVLAMAPTVEAKDWTKVTIATEGAFEPYNFVKPDGKLDGFEIDLIHDLCGRLKIDCPIVQSDWDGMIPALNAGKFDAVMDGMNITPKRQEVINFSHAYANAPAGFMVVKSGPLSDLPGKGDVLNLSKDDPANQKIIDGMRTLMKGKTIGVQVSTIHADFLDKTFKDVATVKEYKTTDERDLDLMSGRLDGVLDDIPVLLQTLGKPEAKDLTLAGAEFRGGKIFGEGVGIGLRKSDPELQTMFNKALDEARADGTLKKLQDKWFKLDMMPPA